MKTAKKLTVALFVFSLLMVSVPKVNATGASGGAGASLPAAQKERARSKRANYHYYTPYTTDATTGDKEYNYYIPYRYKYRGSAAGSFDSFGPRSSR